MFLRRYRRSKNGKSYSYFALVESVRTPAGPRQQIIAHLGELSASQEQRWQNTVTFYNRHGEQTPLSLFAEDPNLPPPDDPTIARIRLNSVGWTNARNVGDVALAHWLWKMLELDQIVDRHVPHGREKVRPCDIVAIEVINRLCNPCSEFALAEHWYQSTALDDLLGIPDEVITKDRLYTTLDQLLKAQTQIENDLKNRLGTLFQLDYDVLLYDLTSSYFEGLAEDNELAKRGYSRDHRSDCKQIILALVVSREGFPLAHQTLVGNTRDVTTVCQIVNDFEQRFGKSNRVWVMDRGMISEKTLEFFGKEDRRYVMATLRSKLQEFMTEITSPGWQSLPDNPEVKVKTVEREEGGEEEGDKKKKRTKKKAAEESPVAATEKKPEKVYYLLAKSRERQKKERAIRRGQRHNLKKGLRNLCKRVEEGKLKKRDKILLAVGRLTGRYPKARPFYGITVAEDGKVTVHCHTQKFREALQRDGAYLLQSNREGWTAKSFWETYIQLTRVEKAFRVMKSELDIRPIWHQYSGRTKGHVFVCFLAYALWKALDHLLKQAKLMTEIHKPDPTKPANAAPKARPMSPEVCLREMRKIMVGDILLETVDGKKLALRRVARPDGEQQRIMTGLKFSLPDRLGQDRVL
jgi:transposase